MVGQLILGRFRVEEPIGSGGFGTVYSAWDERLQRSVAVKVINGEQGAPRVTREAQAVARLSHRNIATLYELAEEGGRAYLVSELIDGETLRDMGRRGELCDRLVAELGAGTAAALAHAHRSGVVHRDVKPENILVSSAGTAKLVDFGIARVAGERTLTGTGDVLGTLAYMAPEQADGQRPGPAADVYSLALTLYECFCGEHPLIRNGAAATARAIGEPIAPLSEVRPDLPAALCAAIDAGLDPDPELRPLASELGAAQAAQAAQLDYEPLPPVLRPDAFADEQLGAFGGRTATALLRLAPGAGMGLLAVGALIAAGAPAAIIAATAAAAGTVAMARPRPALAISAGATIAWLLVGAAEPGAALLAALLFAPLLLARPVIGAALPLPGAAPLLGLAGLAAAYPALAGLTRSPASRALLGAVGYMWLASWELTSGAALLAGQPQTLPEGWQSSLGTTVADVAWPLLSPSNLLMALAWAGASMLLPVLVKGRGAVLDLTGALIWAAGLITVHRLVAGSTGEPAGLVLGALLAAAFAAFAAPRLRRRPDLPATQPTTAGASVSA